ncbi:MAG TPA: glycosyltransferase family 39 protein [Verrucomicrobiae bacterium]|nr:glycosyltransferase family 39 protein [Verrucomicrobiae bacterium]
MKPASGIKWEQVLAAALVVLWAALFLPNLRSNPNWYGDEGEWMEKSWTFIHGTPRVGPIINDFVFPYPYPPLYMLVNGALLRVFGNDIVVARGLGAVTALAAAAILFWIGARLRGPAFGFLCAAALLVYPQTNMNFRWVRSHPMTGTLALACMGFLIGYLQDKRLKDLVWAGVFCSLATAANYYAVGMIPGVIAVAVWVNWRRWREPSAWRDVMTGAATAGAFGVVFVLWYVATQGGLAHLREQVQRLGGMTQPAGIVEVCSRIARFCFTTPTSIGPQGLEGHDVWLIAAVVGLIAFPVARLRGWLVFWLAALMWPIFRKQDNVSWFFYPATVFLPLMALGVGGAAEQVGRLVTATLQKKDSVGLRVAPGVVAFGAWAIVSLNGAWGHFDTMIDRFTQQSIPEAEAAMKYVNEHTTDADFVLVPKQIYWLVKSPRRSMLSHCQTIEGKTNAAWPVRIPRDRFWFDCRWPNAKYVVLASGVDATGRRQWGIDLVYTLGAGGAGEIVPLMLDEKWNVVYAGGRGVAYAPIGPDKKWPVVLDGEYLVLANPQLVKGTP